MKIGLNGQVIQDENPAGPELYTINLFKALAKIDNENEYTVYLSKEPTQDFIKNVSGENKNFKFKFIDCKKMWTQKGLAKELLENHVDVFFTAVHTIPFKRNPKTKYVVMIHGLEHKYTKGYKNILKRLFIERPIKYAIKKSDRIIVPSNATRDEIIKRNWGVGKEKIDVVYEGVSKDFYPREEKEILEVREKYELGKDPYIFFVSTIQPRKNIPNLVRAFSQFIYENQDMKNLKLVIAGKNGWDYEESLEAPQKFGVQESVKFIGRVPSEDLPALFSGSKGYVNVSFEEGFGLPLLESMACGTPSVVSDIPAHREVGDYLPFYANPHNIENIKDGIHKLAYSEYNKQELLDRASLFTWENTAKETLEILKTTTPKENKSNQEHYQELR
jgi:glycosyltransferase involved in cell wall biosynthesis